VTDETLWVAGVGLGPWLLPQGAPADRILHVGHGGAMPGFLAAVYGRLTNAGRGRFRQPPARPGAQPSSAGGQGTPAGMGCAVLASSGTAVAIDELAHELLRTAAEEDPADIVPWTPGEAPPDSYRSVLGRWWGEGFEYVFSWRDGTLQATRQGDAAGKPPAVFQPTAADPDVLRGVSGREVGELLRLTRDPAGTVVRMHWATYRFTRTQETFDGASPST
jgi:hypothetical protein